MIGLLKTIFSGGVLGTIEKVALESIDTVKETAEGAALMVKTLDPNGLMRRELARFASKAYGFYLSITCGLIGMYFFGIGDPNASREAIAAITELFTPITTAWGAIVSASFGVNAMNVSKGL